MIKKTEESFGERIRRLREAKGLSMEVLSHDTGYTDDFLKEIEEGKISPACRGSPPVGSRPQGRYGSITGKSQ